MPDVTACPEARVLNQLINGRLSAADVESIDLHLGQCRNCCEALEQLVEQFTLGQVSGGDPPGEAASRMVSRFKATPPDTASSGQEATSDSLPTINTRGAAAQGNADFELGPAGDGNSSIDETAPSFSVVTGGSATPRNDAAA